MLNDRMLKASSGVALISALWLLVLLSVIAGAMSWSSRYSIRGTDALVGGIQAKHLAEGAFQLAISNLLQNSSSDRILADGETLELEIPGGTALIAVADESGKVDINLAEPELIARLLYSLDLDPSKADSLADAIADYRDEDELFRLNGAESAAYKSAGMEWGTKNDNLDSVEELRRVLGMEEWIFRAIYPYVTVHSGDKGVNPELAGLPVLMAISNDSELSLQGYIERRRRNHADGISPPKPPSVDRRFLSRMRGFTYKLSAVGVTEKGQRSGISTVIRILRTRNRATIQTLDWAPYVESEALYSVESENLSNSQVRS